MSVVYEDLTEEEAYLVAILMDQSGLDLAEFTWKDDMNDDMCWRAWPFQWMWYRNPEKLQIDQCARSMGKSVSIQLRGFIFAFVHPGQEMLITAPELVHLKPVTSAIEQRILSIRLAREMLDTRNRSSGFTHQPFAAQFKNGARILGRIPQRDGKGVKGMHPLWLELDEGQDYPAPGWTELFETLKFGSENSTWRAHGVTRGVRDTFYNLTQPNSGWFVHKYTAQFRPDWTDGEREQKAKMYGGRNSHDYKRNILGEHGDQANPLFVLARLMASVRFEQNDPVNLLYVRTDITFEKMEQYALPIDEFVQVPASHRNFENVWIGMDVGMTNHPTEILVFAEVPKETRARQKFGTEIALQLVSRWHLERISATDQRRVLRLLNEIYRPKAISMDKTGVGLPIYQDMLIENPHMAKIVKGYNFAAKIPVDFDDPENIDDSLIMRNVLEYASDKLREYVDAGWIIFPNDDELIREWQGQSVTIVKTTQNPYGKKEFCVDEATEILTASGWKSRKDLVVGEKVLTYVDGTSRWEPVQAINVFKGEREMLSMESSTHSSLTTMDHRWRVERYCAHKKQRTFEWRTSRNLHGLIRIPRAANHEFPEVSTYSDSLVGLVAWYWTEGWKDKSRIGIGQSRDVNPGKVKIIRDLLSGYGEQGRSRDGLLWRERQRPTGMSEFFLHHDLAQQVLKCVGEEKELLPEFLTALTRSQLDMLIQYSMMADGYRGIDSEHMFQASEARADAWQMACQLAGIATTKTRTSNGYRVGMLRTAHFGVPDGRGRTKKEIISHEGVVWCPTTPSGTWLARRDGKVFFTGNSKGTFHTLDAGRMAILGKVQDPIERMLNDPLDDFGGAMDLIGL